MDWTLGAVGATLASIMRSQRAKRATSILTYAIGLNDCTNRHP